MRRIFILCLLIPFQIIHSCTEELEPDFSKFGYDFFPMETDSYRIYEVEEIIFTITSEPDTLIYQLKVAVSDSVTSNGGEIHFVLERSKRSDAGQPWEIDSIWTAYRNEIRATVFENNIPRIKLVFPFGEMKSWDSNSMNSRNPDEFKMIDLFNSYSSIFTDYENTVRIVQEEKLDSLISLDNRFEIYAKDLGLIEKISSQLEFCQDPECFGQKIVEEGRIYKQILKDYGKE